MFWKGIVNGVIKIVLNLLFKVIVVIVKEIEDRKMVNYSYFKVIN